MRNVVFAAAFALCAAQSFAETHTVTFRRMNGTVLSKVEVTHGANATSLVPAGPDESANNLSFSRWDLVDKLACVTNDVTCWALYEATTAKSPNKNIASSTVVDRATPYSLDEYFQMYNNLAWSDEFSGDSLSASTGWFSSGKNWKYNTDHINNELQKYTTSGNTTVSDGTLKITARRETNGDYQFTSASIKTEGNVQLRYGRCEIRAKLTKQQGTWPAFWLMPTGNNRVYSEIDIFEQLNGSEWIGGNLHLDARNNTSESLVTLSNSAMACPEDGTHWGDAFHRIGVIFNEFEVVWYVDDHIFKRMDVRSTSRYSVLHNCPWYVLLNLAFGGGWPGMPYPDGNNDSRIASFQSEDYEIDYCRIFTNTIEGNTVARPAEPDGARLSGPVKATVWRGWQMCYGKSGASYFNSHLIGEVGQHIKTAMREYFGRDDADIVTFLTRPDENTGSGNLVHPFDVPGVTTLSLSPEAGSNWGDKDKDRREKLRSAVMFNKNRFSQSDSAISSLVLSNDGDYTNCCAVVAELVEKDSGAKVKVVSVNLCSTNGTDYATLFSKLNQFKDERTILLFQSMESGYHNPLKNQASSKLDKAYRYLGEYKAWPTYQFSYATTNCVSATAANPAPLSVPKSNGKPSGVHTNQAYCATVQFEAPLPDPEQPRILYVNVAAGATNTLDSALVTEYITNIVKQGAGTLIASAIPSYTGDFTLEGGVFQFSNSGDFGAAGSGVIDVKDGASLEFRGGANNVLSGKTVNLYGAKAASANAKILFSNASERTLGKNVSICLKDADEVLYVGNGYVFLDSGMVDLGGRELRIKSNGSWKRMEVGATIVNGGSLVFDKSQFHSDGTRKPTLSVACAATASLKFVNGAEMNWKSSIPSNGWTLYCDASTVHGNVNRFPSKTDYPVWDGPVVFANSSKTAEWAGGYNVSNTVFNLKGAVSGSGTLKVGPGWLNLHNANNTYAGAVTVKGEQLTSTVVNFTPILPGSGGIGLWNGAACFPNASSITFTNTARLAFMDSTACTVPNVKFVALAGETQSISGGVHTARSTMAGFVKEGAGTLLIDSPVSVTGLGDVKGGTLKIAYRSDTSAQTQEAMLEPMPQFSGLRFASGTTLDLSDNVGMVLSDLEGAPAVMNSGMFGISGKWKLVVPGGKLDIVGQNAMGGQAAGVLCFLPGATFDLADEAAFKTAVAAAGPDGLLVAEANWILDPSNEQLQGSVALPSPAQSLGAGWSMSIGKGRGDDYAGRGLYLRYSDPSASGYAAWIAGKGISGANAAADKVTNGIANGVRYAFDIDPATSEIGTPIIQVVRDVNGNPAVLSRDLATGRDDVTFGILATPDLTDWSNATLVPMKKFAADGLWRPTASESSGYVFPSQMFFKYKVEVK